MEGKAVDVEQWERLTIKEFQLYKKLSVYKGNFEEEGRF